MCVVNKSELMVILTNRYDDKASSDVWTWFANTWFNQFECQELKFSSKHNILRKHLTQPYTTTTSVSYNLFTQIISKHVLKIRKSSKTRRENPCTPKTIRHPELDFEVGLEFITPRSLTLVIDYFTINSDYYAYLILIRRTTEPPETYC